MRRPARQLHPGVVGLAFVDVVGPVGTGVRGLPATVRRRDDRLRRAVGVPDQQLGFDRQGVAVLGVVRTAVGYAAVVPAIAQDDGEGDVRLPRHEVRDVVGEVVDACVVVGPARGQQFGRGAAVLRNGQVVSVDVCLVHAEGRDVQPRLTDPEPVLQGCFLPQHRCPGRVGGLPLHPDPLRARPAADTVGAHEARLEEGGGRRTDRTPFGVPDGDRPVIATRCVQRLARVADGHRVGRGDTTAVPDVGMGSGQLVRGARDEDLIRPLAPPARRGPHTPPEARPAHVHTEGISAVFHGQPPHRAALHTAGRFRRRVRSASHETGPYRHGAGRRGEHGSAT